MSISDFDPNLMKVVPPSSTQGYDLWARDNAQAIAQQQANIYRMQLTAQQMAERQIEMARLQQAAAMQQERYAHGWHDPRSVHATVEGVVKEVEQDLNKLLWNIKPIPWSSIKPQYLLLGVSVGLIVLAIILKAIL